MLTELSTYRSRSLESPRRQRGFAPLTRGMRVLLTCFSKLTGG